VWAAPALAAGEWGITVEEHNGYGAQESLCPSKAAEPNAEPPCGVDPYTLSGETFARESAENTYTIKVANKGSEQIGAPVTVLDELPPGMVLTLQGEGIKHPGSQWECTMAGAAAAECTTAESRAPGTEYEPITLTVHVNPQAAVPSENKVTVHGGGVKGFAINKTTVTEAVPFGIHRFTTGVVESLSSPWTGNPFTQAGGHPLAYLTELEFNYTPGESGVSSAGGGGKEIQVELPPGFLGNPQNTPRCPLRVLSLHRPCPENTAVGYTAISQGGPIENGRAKLFEEPPAETFSSLLYNLEPAPGHVVALGFIILSNKGSGGTPIILEGKVRSDGDYGVTVGTNASPNLPRVPAVKLTTCENGAHRESLEGRNIFSCNAAPAGSKPFLTNPTECTSAEPGKAAAPLTTAVANAWNDPADYQRKTVAANLEGGALGPKSLLTGCESLPFAPEIQFTPSPPSEGGSSQADEPTGMTLALTIPQAKEEPGVNETAAVKNLKMKLPAGMTLSPSAADGLAACSNAEFGLGTEFGPGSQHSEPAKPASCPLASQIGTVEVFTPLLSGARQPIPRQIQRGRPRRRRSAPVRGHGDQRRRQLGRREPGCPGLAGGVQRPH
jgi:uncharacterized repeat protein (TIGR01451 family)